MGIIVVLVLLGLVAVIGVGIGIIGQNLAAGAVGGVALLLAALIFVFTGFSTVGQSDVGIVTSFGHLDGDLTPGIHFVAPVPPNPAPNKYPQWGFNQAQKLADMNKGYLDWFPTQAAAHNAWKGMQGVFGKGSISIGPDWGQAVDPG